MSQLPRTLETALAMGFAVDETLPLAEGYATIQIGHLDHWASSAPYARYAELLDAEPAFASVARNEWTLWLSTVARVDDGERALVVSHGGSIEPTLVAAVPGDDYPTWGAPFSHLDGATVGLEGERCVSFEIHRYIH